LRGLSPYHDSLTEADLLKTAQWQSGAHYDPIAAELVHSQMVATGSEYYSSKIT
jgi:hypothetical protein